MDSKQMTKEEKDKIYLAMAGERVYATELFNERLHTHHEIERKGFLAKPEEQRIPKLVVIVQKVKEDKTTEEEVIICAFGGGFEDTDSKYKVMMGLGAKIAEQNIKFPLLVFLQSEAWVSIPKQTQEQVKNGDYIQPSKDPNRTEAIITAGMTIDGRTNFAMSTIIPKTEKARFLSEPNYMDYKVGAKGIESHSDLLKQFWLGYSGYLIMNGGFEDDKKD